MSNLKQTGTSGIERQSDDDRDPPKDEDGYYICYRECTDGEPCQRRISAPWVACYDHFGEPPLDRNQAGETDGDE
ncbi:hypothetical protein [Halogranum rubrum]|uniref:Uncharacterized protein n=1 Tax=Halogranum salarium B-1 TaxID=1210908 RepID=J3A2A7_9EURY|nr:hypothetical protein [Halogranum salarium]EJN59463.1 hypothetical protein HSB1_16210 [Halogranum salarium B-1]